MFFKFCLFPFFIEAISDSSFFNYSHVDTNSTGSLRNLAESSEDDLQSSSNPGVADSDSDISINPFPMIVSMDGQKGTRSRMLSEEEIWSI
mgnify:CR=1 FL=1